MRDNRGFTLIEMLIVIAIISILSGIVLVGVTGFQASARDTQRVADLRFAQNLVELYYARCGHYPGDSDCETGDITSWGELTDALSDIPGANKLPGDDAGDDGKARFYYESCDTQQSYVLGVALEEGNAAANNDVQNDELTCSRPSDLDCDNTTHLCLEP